MDKYNPKKIEPKWQNYWEKEKIFEVVDDKGKNKYYCLDMFPYPSSAGLHVGHPEGYTATDIVSRYRRMKYRENILHPMGFDAFGLPAENYAIKINRHPKEITGENIKNFIKQLKSFGFSYDWTRQVNTSDPSYYKWTQWMFRELYKKGLAYKKQAPVNWCEDCKTVLAREQVIDGKCERCKNEVIQKDLNQWFFKVTEYAEELLEEIENLDWPQAIKSLQRNWIGKSEGALVKFQILNSKSKISSKSQISDYQLEIFTTRPDTLFGATFMVVAPEHKLISNLKFKISNFDEVKDYIEKSKKKSELERTDLNKDKTGVEIKGIKAINPANNEAIPVFIADYVMMSYGTGAIMAVPAHDERDFEFANKYGVPVRQVVVEKNTISKTQFSNKSQTSNSKSQIQCFTGDGIAINSGKFDGLTTEEFKQKITTWLEEKNLGQKQTQYKLRDWLVSRQRYWGAPIPVIYCDHCAAKKPTVLLAHGILGNSQENWFPWFKKEIEYHGYDAIIPDLPNPDKPKLKEWLNNLNNLKTNFNDDLTVVAHSLGAITVCRFIQDNNLKVKKLILVAPTGKSQNSRFKILGLIKKHIDCIVDFNNTKVDWEKLNSLIGKAVVYFSDNDPYIPLSVQEDWEQLDAEIKIFKNKGHFNEDAGIIEFPDIVEEILKDKSAISIPSISFYNQNTWDSLAGGKKTVETRALNPEEPHRYFGNIKKDDAFRAVNKVTGEEIYFKVTKVWNFKNTKELFKEKKLLPLIRPNYNNNSLKEWKAGYAKNAPDYLERIEKNGIIAWQVEKVIPGQYLEDEKNLPVELPDDVDFRPTGESPLAASKKFHNVKCPKCGASDGVRREVDTMDTFVCSSWYFLRYADPHNDKVPFDKDKVKQWLPVDLYVGGAEHAVLHLMYARFFIKALADMGYLDFREPFLKLRNQGMIIAEDGKKMSKSLGNVINPDEVIKEHGADTFRLYEMFMGPLEDSKPWNTKGIIGIRRFLEKVWKLQNKLQDPNSKSKVNSKSQITNPNLERLVHQTIKKVTEDIENLRFNTAISAMMVLANTMEKEEKLLIASYELLVIILSPFAPHIAEELWQKILGHKGSILKQPWPEYNPDLIIEDEIELAVQVNGKVRDQITVPADITEEDAKSTALGSEKVKKWLEDKEPKKVIYIKKKLISIVV